jgi:hypothetical protein
VMAAAHHDRLAGLLLNDIGAEINPVGLKRILNSIDARTSYVTWDDAAQSLAANSIGFKNISHDNWVKIAKRIFIERNNHPCADYDPLLTHAGISVADIDAGKLQNLWDLLSNETLEKMHALLPNLISKIIPDRGHVPFLDEVESLGAIQHWLNTVDHNEKGRHKVGPLK